MTNRQRTAPQTAQSLTSLAAEAGWSGELVTRTGTRFHVRPARPGDAALLGAFFRTLRPEDLRHRFLSAVSRVGDGLLRDMVRDDDPHAINFLAFDADGAIIATAMLVSDDRGAEGEFALATSPDWLNRGVSWTLLDHLLRYAAACGLRRIFAIGTSDDARAFQLEREMGFEVARCADISAFTMAEKTLSPQL